MIMTCFSARRLLLLGALVVFAASLQALAQPPGSGPDPEPSSSTSQTQQEPVSPVDSDEDLRRLIQQAGGNQTQLITSLEGYLRRWPRSQRRSEIEEEVYKLAVKVRDRDRILSYGPRLIEQTPGGVDVLVELVTALRERRQTGDLVRARSYAEQLVREFDALLTDRPKPRRLSQARWEEQKQQGRASVYLTRGRVYADLGEDEKAKRDLQQSAQLAPLAVTFLALADLTERRQSPPPNKEEVLGYLRQALLLGLIEGADDVDLPALRQRLRTLYLAQYATEAGLGDQLLTDLDAYLQRQAARKALLTPSHSNASAASGTDPLAFRLSRPAGDPLDLASLRGKVVVMNFWATWCGPCRTELPLFEKTIERYRNDPSVSFLAVTTDEDREAVLPYLQQYGYQLPVVFADGLEEFFDVTAIPTTIILGPAGKVSSRLRGYNPQEDFVALLQQRIEEAKAAPSPVQ
jgi:thiol-disulfide isomerase/thioredoxin